jgi:carboxyl-terminal processing protease
MKRRLIYGLVAVALSLNLLVGARVYLYSVEAAENDDAYPSLKLFTTVMEEVRKNYVDGENLSYQELVQGALKGMLNTLDPHSEFMEPVKYEELKKDTEGSFGGVGIVVAIRDNYVTVVAPMEDTPGYRAGIMAGDRIVRINGKSAEKFSLQDAVKRLRGDPGTEVAVTIQRPSTGETKEFKLIRADIKVYTVKDINGKREYPLNGSKIGYIRLTQFGERTSPDLDEALKTLESQGMQGLVLDLRNNPGGLLDQAVYVCEKFLPRGTKVVSTEGRQSTPKSEYIAKGRDRIPHVPMVILVNIGSASASEIVAGCLQDLKRAVVLGEKTFGKGSVQSILPLPDGSALRLTTAKYYTPSHKVIHEEGITPDIVVPMTDEDERDLFIQRTPGGLESLDEKERERVAAVRDLQLERAMDLLKGISLYTKRPAPSGKVASSK